VPDSMPGAGFGGTLVRTTISERSGCRCGPVDLLRTKATGKPFGRPDPSRR
jgi:hypothetical protein